MRINLALRDFCHQRIVGGFRDCISSAMCASFCSPHGLFTCMQIKNCLNRIGQQLSDYRQKPEHFQYHRILHSYAGSCYHRLLVPKLRVQKGKTYIFCCTKLSYNHCKKKVRLGLQNQTNNKSDNNMLLNPIITTRTL